ncbi:malto-oligosyltrehalose trehalohydrolase [Salinibacterium xinjiangense]|uniref:Malto-oligosyltrehalose trehalohydrolase n=1 Tax=Salinibacterium xinjiangense TaxID=386302 RepID=A0A2C8ZX01_9MICO|nr:malto-oligosyltrehalose trehalohydrolase [Salinibacterium xinjiangense]GGL01348.1 malto-oligosyltrehalose trehalohydrolase [Salinibacterium xinjiangense]SOE70603.1 maltooligosyl trehalose hydrolase [Salinibacterium xinjiangense]
MAFEVWAPRATKVTLVLGAQSIALHDVGGGWWSPRYRAEWVDGVDYGYLIDDSTTPLPDPRSRRQPEGVHGLSRSFDTGAYQWRDTTWAGRQLAGSTIYELHIGTYTPEGTLDSAIARLDHLVGLGIDFVEVLPVNGFNGTHNWGYDGVLWYTVHEGYGGPAAYQRFVDACHERGLGVIQDVVYNHLGPSGNYLPQFGPYLDDASSNTWGTTVNLAEPEVREYIIGNALMWMNDYHVDGLRLDAVHALVDPSDKHLLKEMAERTDSLSESIGRPLTLIAESDLNDPKLITPRSEGGYGLTAQWSDDYHHAAHVNLTGETIGYYEDFDSLEALAKTMTRGFFHDGTYSSFRERIHGKPIDRGAVPTWRLVTFTQDHDQIGNRAIGDRLTATLDADQQAIAAVVTILGPFTPMLFMGEEWGATTPWQFFTSHPEPELGTATAEGRIAEFEKMGWDPDSVPDPQDPATFARSKLDWNELAEPAHARLFSLYRELIALRRELPGLTDPAFDSVNCEFDDAAKWFRMDRPGVSVLINFSTVPLEVPAPAGQVLLATSGRPEVSSGSVALPAHSAVVLRT